MFQYTERGPRGAIGARVRPHVETPCNSDHVVVIPPHRSTGGDYVLGGISKRETVNMYLV